MKKTLIVILGIALILAIFFGLRGHTNTEPKQTKTIVVGAPLSLTGSAAVDALNIKRGLDLAKADLAEKGINVDIIYENDDTDAKKTVSAVQKLIAIDKVDFIIGPTWSFLGDAAGPILEQNGMVAFAPANTSEFSNMGKYAFYGATKNSEKRYPLAMWLREHGKKRVAIIVDKSGWGMSNVEAFKLAVADAGAIVVFEEYIPFGLEADVFPTALAKVQAAKADVLLMTGYDEGVTLTIKKSQELDLGIPIIFLTEIFRKLVASRTVTIEPTDEIYYTSSNFSEEFVNKFRSMYGEEPGTYADRAYDGLVLLTDALLKKSPDESLHDYVSKKTTHSGYGATYTFDDRGDIVGGDWIIKKVN